MKIKYFSIFFKILFSLLFILGGIAHFTKTSFYLGMMPSYLPFHLELVYISGVIEFTLGGLLLVPKYSRYAAMGLVSVLIAVFPANINMYLNAEQFTDMSETSLLIRLPIQLLILSWALFYTKKIKTI
jgi:uncharacterized membrane protein